MHVVDTREQASVLLDEYISEHVGSIEKPAAKKRRKRVAKPKSIE
jgi:hypothetical protein